MSPTILSAAETKNQHIFFLVGAKWGLIQLEIGWFYQWKLTKITRKVKHLQKHEKNDSVYLNDELN